MADICNRDDIIDSRDLIEALEDLESEEGALLDEYIEAKAEEDDLAAIAFESGADRCPTERLCNAINALSDFWGCTPEEVDDSVTAMGDHLDSFNGLEELVTLRLLAEQIEDAGDYHHGLTLIRETYFTEYAQELAEDIGAINKDAAWPACHIDWEAASDALKMDYSEAEFDGVTYYYRD